MGLQQLGEAAQGRAEHRDTGRHRLDRGVGRELVVAGGHQDGGGPGQQPGQALPVHPPDEVHLAARAPPDQLELLLERALAGHNQGHARGRRRHDRGVDALLGRQPRRHERVRA
jgi:hypothetical protein